MIWPMAKPGNEMDVILKYSSGTPERKKLLDEIEKMKSSTEEIPLIIGGEEVRTNQTIEVKAPHDHQVVLARAHLAGEAELKKAIEAALSAHETWSQMDWYHRAAIFRKAADLLAGPERIRNIAAIMLNQSKTPFEAEIDLAELVDFWRFNAYYMKFIYEQQPDQSPGEMNRFDWRPLEGFVLAIPPFNFYSIGGNLPTAPALVGNVALWKPARSVIFANYEIMKVLIEAGLPAGVINFVPFSSKYSEAVLKHPDFAGLHFTGTYETLTTLWKTIGSNLENYKNFPRIVGETGGKDFIFVHNSADVRNVVVNIIRGGFEYQGQKCSAVSRVYIPESLWAPIKNMLLEELPRVTYGDISDLSHFMGAIITQEAYEKIVSYIEHAKANPKEYEIIYGGGYDSSKGWFVQPTIIQTTNPTGKLICEEIFGPVVTVYVYPDDKFDETLESCDTASGFGLTGSIFAQDREAIVKAERVLRYTAGNFYINDKPTGAIVARQPFGGARNSGTNDKAGSWLNLLRWLNPRTIKETTVPYTDWRRPYQF
ncbi:MAG: L-glutamate gamma-semialdehyde dehydrogenase [Calditrichaeota bacterium]|nr:MAG: L-glutamate gamma-semialdehyde dehydrogenase [Calditrichota bacterium]